MTIYFESLVNSVSNLFGPDPNRNWVNEGLGWAASGAVLAALVMLGLLLYGIARQRQFRLSHLFVAVLYVAGACVVTNFHHNMHITNRELSTIAVGIGLAIVTGVSMMPRRASAIQ